MPYTVFSHRSDPEGALQLLKEAGFEVEGTPEKWEASRTFGEGSTPTATSLVVTYDREWLSPPNWPEQLNGMKGYFSQFPIPPDREGEVMDRNHIVAAGAVDEL